MTDYFPPKPFDYEAFVGEVRDLITPASEHGWHDWNRGSLGFRQWRTALEHNVEQIERLGYPIKCRVVHRLFRVNGLGDDNDQAAA